MSSTFDPRDFHAFAIRCSRVAPDEAACRTAISRAYYSAFLVAEAYVIKRGIRAHPRSGQKWGPHERIILAVGEIRNPSAGLMEASLVKLKHLRVKADYRMGYRRANAEMADAILDAERIIAWIDALPR